MVAFLEGSLIALWVCQMSDVISKADFQVDNNDCVRWTPKRPQSTRSRESENNSWWGKAEGSHYTSKSCNLAQFLKFDKVSL